MRGTGEEGREVEGCPKTVGVTVEAGRGELRAVSSVEGVVEGGITSEDESDSDGGSFGEEDGPGMMIS